MPRRNNRLAFVNSMEWQLQDEGLVTVRHGAGAVVSPRRPREFEQDERRPLLRTALTQLILAGLNDCAILAPRGRNSLCCTGKEALDERTNGIRTAHPFYPHSLPSSRRFVDSEGNRTSRSDTAQAFFLASSAARIL
jgi:hypothetical protein